MSVGAIGRAALRAVAIGQRIAADAAVDSYAIRRATSTPDGAGGYATATTTVEAGRAILTGGTVRPLEQAIADRLGVVNPYTVRALPATSLVTERDTILIAGRTFEVRGVARTEALRAVVTAVCEEVL